MTDVLQEIKNNIPTFSSDKLCQFVICHRYLNYSKDLSILAMEELAKRRINGDNFDFESYIDKCLSELPAINITPIDVRLLFNMNRGK